jgi:hypothetical protein
LGLLKGEKVGRREHVRDEGLGQGGVNIKIQRLGDKLEEDSTGKIRLSGILERLRGSDEQIWKRVMEAGCVRQLQEHIGEDGYLLLEEMEGVWTAVKKRRGRSENIVLDTEYAWGTCLSGLRMQFGAISEDENFDIGVLLVPFRRDREDEVDSVLLTRLEIPKEGDPEIEVVGEVRIGERLKEAHQKPVVTLELKPPKGKCFIRREASQFEGSMEILEEGEERRIFFDWGDVFVSFGRDLIIAKFIF